MVKKNLKILFAAYECAPFYKRGGLGGVIGSLSKTLKKMGVDVRVVIPHYQAIRSSYPSLKKKNSLKIKIAREELLVDVFESRLPGSAVPVYFIGNKYFHTDKIFDDDSRFRFALFSSLMIKTQDLFAWQPDIIHANDWHTGLISVFLKKAGLPVKTVFTIHNLAYTGKTSLATLARLGLTEKDFFSVENGTVTVMREAILKSDSITTVSLSYAKEILTPEFDCGLGDALRKRKKDLVGILNGLDYDVFSPEKDKFISVRYSSESLDKKAVNKIALQKASGLVVNSATPLLGIISRLAGQKGFDLLESITGELMRLDLQLVVLGTGDPHYEKFLARLNEHYSSSFCAHLKFDASLSNQIYAGSDLFLMPSQYEPCGLGQLAAMKYGNLPLVRQTGGLKDTVTGFTGKNIKTANGFSFAEYQAGELFKTIKQAIAVFHDQKTWRALQSNAMRADFSWNRSAAKYLKLYQKLALTLPHARKKDLNR